MLGLKGEIRNNVLAAERLLATSTPVLQWRGILQIFGYKCLGEGDEQTGGFFGGNVGNVGTNKLVNILMFHVINC